MTIHDAATRYDTERPVYERLHAAIVARLKDATHANKIPCRVTGRAKDASSLLKKMLKKGRSYEEVHDKAGVRIALNYPDDRESAAAIVRSVLIVHSTEDKEAELGADRIGYRGLHFETQLGENEFNGKYCEVQIHRPGEALWAGLAHDLTYKAPTELPLAVRRKLNRLVVLAEIIDNEATDVRSQVIELANRPEAKALSHAVQVFNQHVATRHDPELSIAVLRDLVEAGLITDEFEARLAAFSTASGEKLAEVFSDRASSWNPLFTQPEAVVLFMLLDEQPELLISQRPSLLGDNMFEDLASAWGVTV